MSDRRQRILWGWIVALGLAGLGLVVACAWLLQQRDGLIRRVAALEDQLAAYRQLQLEQARWQAEWQVEKRALIRAQREALMREQAEGSSAPASP